MKANHQFSNNTVGRLTPARREKDHPMLLAVTAPALLMLVLALGLAALSMLETTPHPRTTLRSSAPVTITHPTPVPLDSKAFPTVSPISATGSEVIRQVAATGTPFRAHTTSLAKAHALGRTGQPASHDLRPSMPPLPAPRGDTALTPYRMGASPYR